MAWTEEQILKLGIDNNRIVVGVYKITSPSGRIYIGQSINIYKRWKWYQRKYTEPKNYEQPLLYRSFRKYSVAAHNFEILCECDAEELDNKEYYYIVKYNSFDNKCGMNCTLGGGGMRGMVFSEESRKKMSESHKGQKSWNKGLKGYLSEETKKMMRDKKIGKKHSDELKEKNRQAQTKAWQKRKEDNNPNLVVSDETKKR